MNSLYILPKFGDRDVKNIKYSELLEVFNAIFNPSNPKTSRLETIHRLINHLHNVFSMAIKDRYIDHDPSFGLEKEFPTSSRFNLKNQIDTRYAALTTDDEIREFLKDLKLDNKMQLQTKRAIYLQILCVNRPINTAQAKWADIDMQNAVWTIQANEMKTGFIHKVTLSKQVIAILKEQQLFSGDMKFVFPSLNKDGHIHRDAISKAIRNIREKDKYKGVATSHGFRATSRTICSINKAELYKLGITEEAIESVLAHKESNQIKYAYEREKATLEQKHKLMQWYSDYLLNL
ncbi:site-specific integrase [Campylobacter sp. CCUG 57310]|uniref:tyrosine-type recombinase/integrase n=1 Tax=Campylobacter sp. CCUG 57310 TaxID=2517362 RepID=UPI0020B15DF5|nr:site-specific integrase [Campylobacter sp. CCUG 57310]